MIGDDPSKDIKGAQKLGMKACFAKYGWVTTPDRQKLPEHQADYTINSIRELVEVVDKINR